MDKFYSSLWDDIMAGRAYLPIYAAFMQFDGSDMPPIPPILFQKLFKYDHE